MQKCYRGERVGGNDLVGGYGPQPGGSEHECFGKIVFQAVVAGTAHAFGVQFLPDLARGQGAFVNGLPDLPLRYRVTHTNVHLTAIST